MAIYFTSDTHFGSERTLIKSKRPFTSVHQMNEQIVKNWNSIIKEDDVVYHLGDFGDFNFCKRLNGKIHLIVGNHEMKYYGDYEIRYKFKYIKERYGFEDVCYNKMLDIDGQQYFLTHKPSNFHRRANVKTLFGHLHRTQLLKSFGVNVGQDCHYFSPISLDDVKDYLNLFEMKYKRDIDYLV